MKFVFAVGHQRNGCPGFADHIHGSHLPAPYAPDTRHQAASAKHHKVFAVIVRPTKAQLHSWALFVIM